MADKANAKTILTGVKPTGAPHVGNYIGAIRPALKLASSHEKSFIFIADYHALNGLQDVTIFKEYNQQVAACWLALGLDHKQTVFYRQSDIHEIFELTTILSTVTTKGLMDRSHAYKAAVDKNKASSLDGDSGVNMGLYTYPILMAADILIMQADIVPVGKDQIQHIEFTRDIAVHFNSIFASQVALNKPDRFSFKLPVHQLEDEGDIISGLDGRKMSKSYDNTIPLFPADETVAINSMFKVDARKREKLIMKIVTDSKGREEPKDPDESTIYQLYKHFASEKQIVEMRNAFTHGGMGYGDAKKLLAEAITKSLEEPSQKYEELRSDPRKVEKILTEGALRAREVARTTLSLVRDIVGLKALSAPKVKTTDTKKTPIKMNALKLVRGLSDSQLRALERFVKIEKEKRTAKSSKAADKKPKHAPQKQELKKRRA
jgi:tryptophanyl-tRNA synthetase